MKILPVSVVSMLLLSPAGIARAEMMSVSFAGLKNGANDKKVQAYLQGVVNTIHPGGKVSVTGAVASTTYTGDGHVVGPVNGKKVSSYTLFNMDHSPFLMNSAATGKDDRITLSFSFKIYKVSFDYEIFPDGSKEQAPDFTFAADGKTQFTVKGESPSVLGPYEHSPASGPHKIEKSAQYLGSSGTWYFPHGVKKLEFIDWPAHIAIDNLKLGFQAVPEPASLALLGCGLAGLPILRRRARLTAAR
jgi:hypothetical protein